MTQCGNRTGLHFTAAGTVPVLRTARSAGGRLMIRAELIIAGTPSAPVVIALSCIRLNRYKSEKQHKRQNQACQFSCKFHFSSPSVFFCLRAITSLFLSGRSKQERQPFHPGVGFFCGHIRPIGTDIRPSQAVDFQKDPKSTESHPHIISAGSMSYSYGSILSLYTKPGLPCHNMMKKHGEHLCPTLYPACTARKRKMPRNAAFVHSILSFSRASPCT